MIFYTYIAMMLLWLMPGLSFASVGDSLPAVAGKQPFQLGEKLYYRMNYSIFTVGRAEVVVNPVKYYISDRSYYKIDIFGKTAGAAAVVSTVDDNWGALVDTEHLLPYRAWRDLEEGRFRRKEYVTYDHKKGLVDVRVINNETGKFKKPQLYTFEEAYTLDLISGYIYLRTIDFNKYQVNDTIQLKGFLEDKFYDFKILYKGTENLKTRLGVIKTYKLVPIMPDNKIFAGENSLTAWFAADDSRIPVKIDANMFIGRAGCEITGFEGMKIQPEFMND